MASSAAGDIQRGLVQALQGIIASLPPNVHTCAQQVLDIPHMSDSPVYGLILRRPHAFFDFIKTQMQFAGVPNLELSGEDWFEEVGEIRALVIVHLQRLDLTDEPEFVHLLYQGPLHVQFTQAFLRRIRSQDPDLASAAGRNMAAFAPFAQSLLSGTLYTARETPEARELRHRVLRFVADHRSQQAPFDVSVLNELVREPVLVPLSFPPPDVVMDEVARAVWRQMDLGAQDFAYLFYDIVQRAGGPDLLNTLASYSEGFLIYAGSFWEDDAPYSQALQPGAMPPTSGFHGRVEFILRQHYRFFSRYCDGFSWYYDLIEEAAGAAVANRQIFQAYQDEVSQGMDHDVPDADILGAQPLDVEEQPEGLFPGFTGESDASSSSDEDGTLDFDKYCCYCSHRLLADEREDAARMPNREPSLILACGHRVGTVCFRAQGGVTCPMCRQ